MVARLERDIRGRAAHVVPARGCIAQRLDFGVRLTAATVPAFAERDAVAHDDAAHRRVRCGVGDGARRELDGAREVAAIAVYGVTSTPFQKAT